MLFLGMRVGGTRKIIISPTGRCVLYYYYNNYCYCVGIMFINRKSSQIGIDIPCDRTIELEVDLVNVD